MRLTEYQMRAMLLSTKNVFFYGRSLLWVRRLKNDKKAPQKHLPSDKYEAYPFLGDLVQVQNPLFLESKNIWKKGWHHIDVALREILGIPLGTRLDHKTKLAFDQAKVNFRKGVPPENAWPDWYKK